MTNPEQQQQEYRKTCTHHRKGHMVYEGSKIAFDGSQHLPNNHSITAAAQGCNKAKKYVRENQLKSYTVK